MSSPAAGLTPAQRILAALRAEDCAAAAAAAPPHPAAAAATIASVKAALGPAQDPSAWLGPPRAFTLSAASVHLQCGAASALHTDTGVRVAYAPGAFRACGSDLPVEPRVLTGVTAGWRAMEGEGWSLPALAARCRAEDAFALDGGPGFARESLAPAAAPLRAFLEYVEGGEAARDAAPLYVFDEALRSRCFASGAAMSSEFTIPPCFASDEVAAGDARRPLPPSWLLAGPAGSGTPVHSHPLTAGWCTLLSGAKLWVLLPPGAPPELLCVGAHNTQSEEEDLSALAWMLQWGGGGGGGGGGGEGGGRALPATAVTILQRAGETVFIPAAWWHCVLNLTTCTALSHSLYLARDAGLRGAAGAVVA